MLSPDEAIDALEMAKAGVRKLAWALSLHLAGGFEGGAIRVEHEAAEINGLISNVIDRIKTDAVEQE